MSRLSRPPMRVVLAGLGTLSPIFTVPAIVSSTTGSEAAQALAAVARGVVSGRDEDSDSP